jgi:hypothetical protein
VVVADKTTGEPALVVIIEPQGRDDPTKAFSWPVVSAVVDEDGQVDADLGAAWPGGDWVRGG